MVQYCFRSTGRGKNNNFFFPNSTKPLFSNVQAHFWLNLYETCIIANNGDIKVLISKYKGITLKILDYSKL